MADDTFRQDRNNEETPTRFGQKNVEQPPPGFGPQADPTDRPKMTGKIHPAMHAAMRAAKEGRDPSGMSQVRMQGSTKLEELISKSREKSHIYEEVLLPSRGVFYDGKNGPSDGILHIRRMVGEEEQILATPRYVKNGLAVNMIFKKCLQESYPADKLLSADRTFLLIKLRGISYGHEYEVELKCPECSRKFNHVIDLNLGVNQCPDNIQTNLEGKLPISGYTFAYRYSRGEDETSLQAYRDNQLRLFGNTGADDSLMFRTASLLEHIEGLTDKKELTTLLKHLPIQDVAYLRNVVTDPPFGVDTKCQVQCGGCFADFEVELPLEASFFFPRQKRMDQENPA